MRFLLDIITLLCLTKNEYDYGVEVSTYMLCTSKIFRSQISQGSSVYRVEILCMRYYNADESLEILQRKQLLEKRWVRKNFRTSSKNYSWYKKLSTISYTLYNPFRLCYTTYHQTIEWTREFCRHTITADSAGDFSSRTIWHEKIWQSAWYQAEKIQDK